MAQVNGQPAAMVSPGESRLNTNALGPMENAILDFMLQTKNRGFMLHFRDGSKLPLIRADMSGLDGFLGELAAKMKVLRTQRDRSESVG